MAATIQTILKPTRARALDTSGNNNHAQIYSGRGLEFDGVTDYLNTGMTELTSNGKFTITGWFYVNKTNSSHATIWSIADWETSSIRGIVLRISSNDLKIQIGKAGSSTYSAQLIIDNSDNDEFQGLWDSWHRYVVTVDSDASGDTESTYRTLNCYVDGVLVANEDFDNTPNHFQSENGREFWIGRGMVNASTSYASMKASDVQFWDKVWTQDDVTYDYLNPEQLVLNRGGTSLTNSNLKVWYPMNDGHRGNQSYILDASNTGLGDDLVNWSSTFNASGTSTDNFGSWTTNANDSTTFCTFDHDNKTIRLRSTDGTHAQAKYSPNIMQEGVMYKFEYTVSKLTSGSIRVRPQNNTDYTNHTEVGTYSYITTPASSGDLLFRIERGLTSGANDFTVSDVKVYPINDKHNATTVFYGDEQITDAKNRTGFASHDWQDHNVTGTTVSVSGGKLVVVSDDGSAQQEGVKLAINLVDGASSAHAIAAGRTYQIEADIQVTAGSTDNQMQFGLGGNSCTPFSITGSEVTYTKTVTTSNNTGDVQIKLSSTDAKDTTTFTVNNVTIKEIGVASGWTDADQQLDIPQTALQSYNQLAFSDDYRSGIALSDGGTTTHQITTNNHTWSFWMFRNQEDSDTFHYVLQKGKYQENGYYIYQTGGKLAFVTNTSGANQTHGTDATVPKGEWFHAAITIYSSGTASQWYINGQAESSVTGITAPVANTDYTSFYAYDSDNTPPPTTHPGYQCLTELSSWNKQLSEDEIVEIYNDGLALDCTTHSASANLVGYWRNNGLAEWEDLSTNNYHGTPTSITETMLITAGADSSRDSQGFLMNRQRTTNSANIVVLAKQDGTNDEGSYIYLPDNPLYTGSAVTNYTISFWVKFAVNPTDLDHNMHFIDTNQSDANRTFKIHITSGGIIYLYTYYNSSASNESVYCDYGFPGKLGNAIQTPPVNVDAGIGETFDVNNWYHLTWTFDHDRTTGSSNSNADNTNADAHNFTPYKMYVNGICVAVEGREGANSAMTTARSMQAANTPVMIGTAIGSSTNPETGSQKDFKGQIDDICFYSDTLTDEEVLRNYNAGKRSHK